MTKDTATESTPDFIARMKLKQKEINEQTAARAHSLKALQAKCDVVMAEADEIVSKYRSRKLGFLAEDSSNEDESVTIIPGRMRLAPSLVKSFKKSGVTFTSRTK